MEQASKEAKVLRLTYNWQLHEGSEDARRCYSSQTKDSVYMEFSSLRNQVSPQLLFEYFVLALSLCKWAVGVTTESKSC